MPPTDTDPVPGRNSPMISLRRVLLPEPLGATRPVRPLPTAKDRSSKTGVSSGQAKERFEQMMAASDMEIPRMRHGQAQNAARNMEEGDD